MAEYAARSWGLPERHYQLDVDLSALRRLAANLNSWGGVVDAQARKAKEFPDRIGNSWKGATATAINGEMAGLGRVLGKGQSLIFKAAKAVSDFEDDVDRIVQLVFVLECQWQEAYRDYNSAINSEVVGPFESEAERERQQSLKVSNAESWWARDSANYDRRFAAQQKSLADAAREFIRVLAESQLVTLPGHLADTARFSTQGVTAVGLGYVSQQLSPELALARQFQVEGWGSFVNKGQAQAQAQRIAQLRNDGLELSADDRELLAKAAKHPWFAQAYAVARGPGNMVSAPGAAASSIYALQARIPPATKAEILAFQAEQETVIDAEAMILSTASGALGGNYAQYMVDSALKEPAAAYGLSVVMHRGGDFAPEFEEVLTEGIYEADRHGGKAGKWGYSAPNNGVFSSAWVPLYGQPGWADPMTGVLAMKSRDPAQAQRFFLTAADEVQGRPQNRLDYVLNRRSWEQSGPGGTASDQGDALGLAVEAATTKLRDHAGEGSPGWKSAKITGQMLNTIPHKEGSGTDRAVEYEIPPAMRDSVGKVISAYLVDFISMDKESPNDHGQIRTGIPVGFTDGQSYGVHILPDQAKYLLTEVVKNPKAVESLLNSELVLADTNLKYIGSLLHGADKDVSLAEARLLYLTAIRQNGDFLNLLEDRIAQESISQGAEYDAKIKTAVDTWTVVAKTGVSLFPVLGDLAGGVFDAALVNATETVDEALLSDRAGLARQRAEENHGSLTRKLRHIAVRRGFEDDLYFTGLLENPTELSPHRAWELPFLDGDLRVKSKMSKEEFSALLAFIHDRDTMELQELEIDD